eukprot:352275_1
MSSVSNQIDDRWKPVEAPTSPSITPQSPTSPEPQTQIEINTNTKTNNNATQIQEPVSLCQSAITSLIEVPHQPLPPSISSQQRNNQHPRTHQHDNNPSAKKAKLKLKITTRSRRKRRNHHGTRTGT